MKAYGEWASLTPTIPKLLNHLSPKFAQMIMHCLPSLGCLSSSKILCKSDKGFQFGACIVMDTVVGRYAYGNMF